jgi:Skp family chaperone for outer membrane proteins
MLAALVMFIGISSAWAEGYAVVNVKLVMEKAKVANDIRQQVEKKREVYLAEISKQEEQLRAKDQKLKEQRNVLAPEAFEAKRREFQNIFTESQRSFQEKRTKLDNALNKAFQKIDIVIATIIKDLAKEKGFNLALPSSEVMYADASLDITKEVIARLDKKLSRVALEE